MIHKTVLLRCDRAAAFRLFTAEITLWWPPDRRHTADPGSTIVLSPEDGFRERAADGTTVELGRIRVWDPPARIVLEFFVGTDAEHPTEVEVTFVPEADGTRVSVDHRPTPLSEEPWKQRASKFDASWTKVLAALAAHAERVGHS